MIGLLRVAASSNHLSHYVGGIGSTPTPDVEKSELSLSLVCKPSGDFLVAGIQVLGIGTLHPYKVVVGEIENIEDFITAWIDSRNAA